LTRSPPPVSSRSNSSDEVSADGPQANAFGCRSPSRFLRRVRFLTLASAGHSKARLLRSRCGNSPHAPPQPIESTAFNLSLDKCSKVRYSSVKVLLTVSPFGPPFSPTLNPFSQSPRPLSPASTAFLPRAKPRGTLNFPLTPLSTAFTQNARGVGSQSPNPAPTFSVPSVLSVVNSLFSYSCKLFGDSFHPFRNHHPFFSIACTLFCKNTRGGGIQSRFGVSVAIDFLSLCFHGVTNPFFRNSFLFTSIQNPRGVNPCLKQISDSLCSVLSVSPWQIRLDFAFRTKYCSTAKRTYTSHLLSLEACS
jgi:hypothetical protein